MMVLSVAAFIILHKGGWQLGLGGALTVFLGGIATNWLGGIIFFGMISIIGLVVLRKYLEGK